MLTNEPDAERGPNSPMVYSLRLRGHLDPQWTDWFEGMTITLDADGNTRLVGVVSDQAALHGLLKKVRDLGLPLLSVDSEQPGTE